jgi:creatinine amidohydrolase
VPASRRRSGSLEAATWIELDAAPRGVLLVPLGATEQHGPHLPLGTDTEIAVALCETVSPRFAGMLVAPALAYGSSGEHADFPGTLSIGAEATELVLLELGRSASRSFDRVMFVSAHGGNAAPLRRAVERLRYEGRDVRHWSPRWGGDLHAGHVETSLMLALAPTFVRMRDAAPGNPGSIEDLLDDLVRRGVRGVSANGVLGDPTAASVSEGWRLLVGAITDLVEELESWGREVGSAQPSKTFAGDRSGS